MPPLPSTTAPSAYYAHTPAEPPPAIVARVIETTAKQPIRNRSRYANGALRKELEEKGR